MLENKLIEQSNQSTNLKLIHAFNFLHIPFPIGSNPCLNKPRRWLARGEPGQSDRLKSNRAFTPQYGEEGSSGVFFADCMGSLMVYKENGIYYIMDSAKLKADWLVFPSASYQNTVNRLMQQNHLDRSHLCDCYKVEELIYKNYFVYDALRGICTVPYSLPLNAVDHIIVMGKNIDLSGVNAKTLKKAHIV